MRRWLPRRLTAAWRSAAPPSPSLTAAVTATLHAHLQAVQRRLPGQEGHVVDLACGTGEQLFLLAEVAKGETTYWGLASTAAEAQDALHESARLRLSDRCLFLPQQPPTDARLPRIHLAYATWQGPLRLTEIEAYVAMTARHLHEKGRLVLVGKAPAAGLTLPHEALKRLAHLHRLRLVESRVFPIKAAKSTKYSSKSWIFQRRPLLFPKKKPDFEERVCLSTEVPGYYTVVIEKEAT